MTDSPVVRKCPTCGSRDRLRRNCIVENCGELHAVFSGGHLKAVCSDSWHSVADPTPAPQPVAARDLAERFHTLYESLAPKFGYETRKESAKPWSQVPEQNKNLMIAVCEQLIADLRKRE